MVADDHPRAFYGIVIVAERTTSSFPHAATRNGRLATHVVPYVRTARYVPAAGRGTVKRICPSTGVAGFGTSHVAITLAVHPVGVCSSSSTGSHPSIQIVCPGGTTKVKESVVTSGATDAGPVRLGDTPSARATGSRSMSRVCTSSPVVRTLRNRTRRAMVRPPGAPSRGISLPSLGPQGRDRCSGELE